MQLALGGSGAVFCAIGAWLALHIYREIMPLRVDDDPAMFLVTAMETHKRFSQFTFAGVLFLIGVVLIVGACIVHQLDQRR